MLMNLGFVIHDAHNELIWLGGNQLVYALLTTKIHHYS